MIDDCRSLVPSPVLLIRHFLAVVSYTIWLVLTQSTVDINAYSKGFMYRIIMAYQVVCDNVSH